MRKTAGCSPDPAVPRNSCSKRSFQYMSLSFRAECFKTFNCRPTARSTLTVPGTCGTLFRSGAASTSSPGSNAAGRYLLSVSTIETRKTRWEHLLASRNRARRGSPAPRRRRRCSWRVYIIATAMKRAPVAFFYATPRCSVALTRSNALICNSRPARSRTWHQPLRPPTSRKSAVDKPFDEGCST